MSSTETTTNNSSPADGAPGLTHPNGLSGIAALYDEVPLRWGRHIFSDSVRTRLLPPVHGDSSGVRGAAWLWNQA